MWKLIVIQVSLRGNLFITFQKLYMLIATVVHTYNTPNHKKKIAPIIGPVIRAQYDSLATH